jgi:serine/threonine protein kinase
MIDRSDIALCPGQAIGRYEIVSVMGCGAMGPTYRARDPSTGVGLVIKEFLPGRLAMRSDGARVVSRWRDEMLDFVRARARFADEGEKLCKLKRAPFVVRAVEVIDANCTSYIVFEKVIGITLQRRLANGARLRPAEVERLLPALLEGLQHVHEAGLLHGDVRPANIMLTVFNTPRLIDFGDTRAWMQPRFLPATPLSTLCYDPPEKITGEERGATSDVYALAATLYRAISGERPPSAVDRLKGDRCRPLAELALPGFDPRLLSAIDKGMAVIAGDRPNSAAAWRRMIRPTDMARPPVEQLPDEPASASVPSSRQAIREQASLALDGRPRRGLWIGAEAVALTAIVASALTGGLYLTREDHLPSPAVATGGPVSPDRNPAEVPDHIETAAREAKLRALQKIRDADRATLQSIEEKMEQRERVRQDAEAKRQADAEAEAERQAAAQEAKRQADAKAEAERQAAAAQEAKRQADAKAEAERQAPAQEAKQQADAKAEAAAELVPPSPSAPVVQQTIEPTAAEPEGAPGLLVRARSGETLQTLYRRIYRGLTPPPFASVAAINPEPIRPGDILTFPTPVNGWVGPYDADAVSNIR